MAAGSHILRISTVGAVLMLTLQPAPARDFFHWLFGGFHHRQSVPAEARPYVDPFGAFDRADNPEQRQDRGPAAAFCVRTCDGFHFVVHASGPVSAADMCRAFCPGSATRLYYGSNIDTATASDGSRYAALDTAYAYRKRLSAGCTCNGRNIFGLADIDVNTDPTLKPGDVVVTKHGPVAFAGKSDKSAEFAPAASYPRFSASYRAALAKMRVAQPMLEEPGAIGLPSRPAVGQTDENRSAAK